MFTTVSLVFDMYKYYLMRVIYNFHSLVYSTLVRMTRWFEDNVNTRIRSGENRIRWLLSCRCAVGRISTKTKGTRSRQVTVPYGVMYVFPCTVEDDWTSLPLRRVGWGGSGRISFDSPADDRQRNGKYHINSRQRLLRTGVPVRADF